MNTLEISNYMQNFKNFKGVYPRDLLTFSLSKNTGIIVNTDLSTKPGEHWVSIYKNKDNEIIYFDSFGFPPLHEEIIRFIIKNCDNGWYYNTITYQSVYQDTCGMYCIYFITCMLRHGKYENFQTIFRANPDFNDILAKILYKVQNRK